MLGAMFSGRHKLAVDDGHYFIDRDGTHFRHILNYLRCPEEFDAASLDEGHVKELRKELKYYDLESLMFPPITEIQAIDFNGNKVVCRKVDGIWKYTSWGSNAVSGGIYYCNKCYSGNRSKQFINSTIPYCIVKFNNLVSEIIDPKQPVSTVCSYCGE